MADEDDSMDPSSTDPPDVTFIAPGRSEGATLEEALTRHGLSIVVEYDVTQALDNLGSTGVECLVVPEPFPGIDLRDLLERVRAGDPLLPVIVLATQSGADRVDRLVDTDRVAVVPGEIESVSYDRLADRIRSFVASYRTAHARQTERDIVKRLEERIHQTERKITALHSVAMGLNAASTAEDVYRETVNAAEEILDLDICFAFAAIDDQFVPMARSSTPTDRDLRAVPLDAGVMGQTYRTGNSERVVDMDLHALADPAFGDYQSGISVPIGEFGVFQAVSKQAGGFDEIDLELTELLTAHAASVLQRLSFEDRLRLERDRYAALFENSHDCILEAEFVEDDALIRRVNPSFESVFGYAAADVVDRPVDDVVVAEDRRAEARDLTNQVRNGEVVQAEVRRRTSKGLKDFLLRSVPIEGERLYAVYTDITDQKETERTIERQKERLDSFASTVSHDLRNPLTIAEGRLALGRETHDNEHLQAVAQAHTRIQELIEDLLALARQGDCALTVEPVRLTTVIDHCWDALDTGAAALRIETDLTIRADDGRLEQLLMNLIGNAIDHAGDGVTVTIGAHPDGFYVADDGPGIPPETREQVFEAGYSSRADGTGFGLSIVEQIVEVHGWAISVTAGTDGGARFEITGVEIID